MEKKIICHKMYNYRDALDAAKVYALDHKWIRLRFHSIPFVETEYTIEYFVPVSQYYYWSKGKTYFINGKKYISGYEVRE